MKKLIIPDSHSIPGQNNDRADWLGQLICDEKPDVVIHLGDSADMPSLCSFDKGKRTFQGRNYKQDIDSHLDFQDRMWNRVKKQKKKLPLRVFLEGNHENRIEKALDASPELEGTISFNDLMLDDYYDIVVRYEGGTPGVYHNNGVYYAHYFSSGVMGRPISGEHPAYTLLTKKFRSCTQGHTHTFDYCVRSTEAGDNIQSLVAGCFQDYNSTWAGDVNKLWWRGCFIKDNVEDGNYDLRQISISSLQREYS